MKLLFIKVLLVLALASNAVYAQKTGDYRDINQPSEKRIAALLKELTLEEKISMLGFRSPGVPRLGIPRYNWWNEGLHGVARAGEATVFPQAIALAATFSDSLVQQVADAISTEARAKHNLAVKSDRREQYLGLTLWSPNINIFRDPRWGRGQETYGEDPYLTARIGTAFVRGLQGADPNYLKTSACAKHFAVHSGPEANRHTFNAVVDEKDLRETYLYAFNALVNAGVESVMCGYNRVNDEPCCTSNTLLRKILREEWKFKGHIVTDCWALEDIWKRHQVKKDAPEVAAAALKSGINMDCSNLLQDDLKTALDRKLISEKDIDNALIPSLRTLFKLGLFDTNIDHPYAKLGEESVRNEKHLALARQSAQKSMVLLKNNNHLLPLSMDKYKSLMVVGPTSANAGVLLGNYHGVSPNLVTFAEGITDAAGPGVGVQYDLGCTDYDTTRFGGVWAAGNSDLIVAAVGLTPVSEGEEGDAFLAPNGGDKMSLSLPPGHVAYLRALRKTGKPVVVVVTAGSAIDIQQIEPYADAIILAWYSGEQGGNALADILFGKVSPSGKLPLTFYKALTDLPAYDDYSMANRTYRYFAGDVQFPFGYGLSYTTFEYGWKQSPRDSYTPTDTLSFSCTIKNTGNFAGDEVAQLYIDYPDGSRLPVRELRQFKRVPIDKGASATVTFKLPASALSKWDLAAKKWFVPEGKYELYIGSHSLDKRLSKTIEIRKANTKK